MGRLDPEARLPIKTLAARGATNSHIARLLGVTEGAVRHHVARMQAGALDGRSRQEFKAACVAAAIACRPGFFLSVRVLSRLFRRLFLERLTEAPRVGSR